MLDFLPDNTMLKLSEVARELNLQPELLLLYIGTRGEGRKTVLQMLVDGCKWRGKIYDLYADSDVRETPEQMIVEDYIPINRYTIEHIRRYGKYSTSAHEVMIVDDGGFMILTYTKGSSRQGEIGEDVRLEATMESLYLTNYHAKAVRKSLEAKEVGRELGEVDESIKSLPTLDGDSKIMKALGCSWNTCLKRMREFGVNAPDKSKGEIWRLPVHIWAEIIEKYPPRKKIL